MVHANSQFALTRINDCCSAMWHYAMCCSALFHHMSLDFVLAHRNIVHPNFCTNFGWWGRWHWNQWKKFFVLTGELRSWMRIESQEAVHYLSPNQIAEKSQVECGCLHLSKESSAWVWYLHYIMALNYSWVDPCWLDCSRVGSTR